MLAADSWREDRELRAREIAYLHAIEADSLFARGLSRPIGELCFRAPHLLDHLFALRQKIAVSQGLSGFFVEAHRVLQTGEVELVQRGFDADLFGDRRSVALGKIAEDAGDMVENVDIRGELGGGAVEEDHVLEVKHQWFG